MPLRAVMWLVGLAGAAFGALVRPVWTHNLIGGQILAGTVSYPSDSVVPALYLTPWSALVQVAAIGLRSGAGEWALSVAFSAVQGGLATLALAWVSWVFSRRVAVAALVPVVALYAAQATPMWVGSSLRVFHGHLYPNVFPVGPSLFAPIAMFLGLIAISTAASRRWSTAVVILAVLPCVHIGLAVPFAIALGVMAWQDAPTLRAQAPSIRTAAWIGSVVSALSGVAHLVTRPTLPEPVADSGMLARVFAERWDDHSRLISLHELGPLLEMAGWWAVLTVVLARRPDDEATGARRLLYAVGVVTLLSSVYTVVAAVAPGIVPWPVRVALVTRWLNITSWVVFAGGLAALARAAMEGSRVALAALGGAIVLRVSGVTLGISIASQWEVVQAMAATDGWPRLARTAGLVYPLVVCGGLWWARRMASTAPAVWTPRVLGVLAVLLWFGLGWKAPTGEPGVGTCTAPLAVARSGTGGLIVGADLWEASWIQVRTRRPVVLDPMDLNIVPFTPAALPKVAEVLREVYGVDAETGPSGRLDRAWPSFSRERWTVLATRYGATDVLVTDTITLPLVARATGDGCTLYQLPGPAR